MKKNFVIVYKPNKFSAILDPEFIIPVIILQIFSLAFTLFKNMFVEDLVGAIALGFFPIMIFGLGSLVWLPFCCFKLVFDYKQMIFIKKNIFYKKVYSLNEIDIKKEYRKSGGTNTNIPMIIISYNDKKLCEINGESFEEITKFSINHILDLF